MSNPVSAGRLSDSVVSGGISSISSNSQRPAHHLIENAHTNRSERHCTDPDDPRQYATQRFHMNDDRTIADETVAKMVQRIEPTWMVREATPATDGHHIVYHLDVDAEAGRRQCVLKATPPGKSPTCGDEARMLAILDAQTSIPVPKVLGVVDDHTDLPAPFFLSSTVPGANYGRTALTEFSAADVERLARSTGRHLAALHRFDAVDAYGFVAIDTDETLDGERPGDDAEHVVVRESANSWTDYLESEAERLAAGLAETRFGGLYADVRPALEARIERLSGEFDSVVARIDQSLDNVLLDPETHAVTGLLDWEFCVAATPAYDLSFVAHSLAGGHWALLPDVPDRRETIQSALLDAYREAGSPRAVEKFHENEDCYVTLARLHSMCHFENWVDRIDATDERREEAARVLRARVTEVLDDGVS